MLYIIIAAIACVLDQLMKLWTASNMELHGILNLIPGILRLKHEHNTGAALSILSNYTWLLAVLSVLAAIFMLILLRSKGFSHWEKISLALVLGGTVGNAVDRIVFGYVVDMLEIEFWPIFVFNVADIFIDVGAALFVIFYITRSFREEKQKKGVMPELERLRKTADEKADGTEGDDACSES